MDQKKILLYKTVSFLENKKREHYECADDPYYSCPKSTGGCADNSKTLECDCGADEFNLEAMQLVSEIRNLLFKPLKP